MVPDAPIDGKLPSVKPEDRSGDFIFSRGSNLAATRVNKDSLIEKGRENLLLQSNQFDTTWTKSNATLTSGQSGYDGSLDAWLLSKTGTGTLKQELTQSGVQSFSIYAKAGTSNWIRLLINGVALAYYDLSNGVVGTTSYSTFIDANIESVGGGWYRCSLVGSGSTSLVNIVVANADNDVSNTSGSIYIQDAQLEQGLVATEYIDTTTATVQKGILENLPRLDYSGGASCPSLLLEPQRTNILAYSEGMFDSSNFTPFLGISVEGQQTDLNGTNTAVKLSNFVQNSARLDYNTTVAAVDGKTYTYSAYYKGSGDIRINVSASTGVGGAGEKTITLTNEWVRHSVTTTFSSPTGNVKSHLAITRTANNDAEVYLCFAQIEEGSYPTSYIPTYGSSVTRSQDVCNGAVDATNFNDSEGVLYAEIAALADDGTFRNISVNNGTTAQSVRIYYRNTANKITALIGSSSGGGVTVNVANLYTFNKIALVYQNDNAKLFVNGILEGTIQGITMPTGLNQLDFNIAGVLPFYGKAKEVIYFPTALTDDECIALTTI